MVAPPQRPRVKTSLNIRHRICGRFETTTRETLSELEVAIVSLGPPTRVFCSMLLLSMTVITGCTRKPTVEEAEGLLREHFSNSFSIPEFECRDGEKDWDYLCQVRHQPTPAAVRQGVRTRVERVGVTIGGAYRGAPLFSLSTFPGEGPIPSRAEYPAWLRQVSEEAVRRLSANRHSAR